MRRGFAVFISLLSLLLAGCASQSSPAKAEKKADVADAKEAALHWLNLLDQGDYEEAFEWEAQDYRMFRTQQQFVRFMQARRAPFGRALGRSALGLHSIHKFAGVPEGDYQSIVFKTNFEHKNPTAERVILVRQTAGWRVIDYRIY